MSSALTFISSTFPLNLEISIHLILRGTFLLSAPSGRTFSLVRESLVTHSSLLPPPGSRLLEIKLVPSTTFPVFSLRDLALNLALLERFTDLPKHIVSNEFCGFSSEPSWSGASVFIFFTDGCLRSGGAENSVFLLVEMVSRKVRKPDLFSSFIDSYYKEIMSNDF